MNRIFHARITWYQYFYLILLGVLAFYLLWIKTIILAALCMLLLVFFIERFIHTTYTITTNDKLIISTGRFTKTKTIDITDIVSVEKKHSAKMGRFSVTSYLLIRYSTNKYVAVLPIREKEFINLLSDRVQLFRTRN